MALLKDFDECGDGDRPGLLPRTHQDDEFVTHGPKRNKVKCLDGLRGIACFIVYNYHFLWPWTPLILMGYNAQPPISPSPYAHPMQLPILCLIIRGRPMVAVFFAISGYVLCRHIQGLIHQDRLEAAYKALSSAVFRRVFRLYIPVTISMALVALLAQMGVFKSEYAIYKGIDSWYINGTKGFYLNSTQISINTDWNHMMLHPPKPRLDVNGSSNLNATAVDVFWNTTWIHYGGMWEEHPIIHPNMTTAVKNFTAVYAEWANPFTFNPYHPRYDPHAYTIPMELRGSMVLYVLLLGTAALKAAWRLPIGVFLALFSLRIGRWEICTFIGGMVLSELDLLSSSNFRLTEKSWAGLVLRRVLLLVALYLMSYPDTNAAFTPGFRTLAAWAPKYYHPLGKWMFWHSIGALILLPCILRSPLLRRMLETRIPQYLGKISFSFYLVHGPVLHSLGFWIMPSLFDRLGKARGLAIGWPLFLAVSLELANLWYRSVDVWSVGVGKRVEQYMRR